MTTRHVTIVGALATAFFCAALVHGQEIWVGGGFNRFTARFAKPDDFDGQFLYCRGFFGSRARRGRLEHRLSGRRQQFLGPARRADPHPGQVRREPPAAPRRRPARRPDAALPLSDALHGKRRDAPVLARRRWSGLRDYLLKGGFLWVDDFWGSVRLGELGARDLARASAGASIPIFDIPHFASDHAHRVRRDGLPAGARRSRSGIGAAAAYPSAAATARRFTTAASRTRTDG